MIYRNEVASRTKPDTKPKVQTPRALAFGAGRTALDGAAVAQSCPIDGHNLVLPVQ